MFDKNYKIDDLMGFDEEYVLHTYTRKKIRFAYGEGCKLYTPCSKEFIDFGSGIGVCSVGHGNKKLAQDIAHQARDLIHLSNLYLIEPQALLAKKIIELCGYDMRVFFSNSGAEANECAIKIARKFGEKNGKIDRYKIITLESSFHGRTISTLKATGQDRMHQHFAPFPDGFMRAKDIDDIYNVIDSKTCGVLLELIQGEGGIFPMDKQKIQNLAKFLKQKDILLMVDEVQSGIYKTGEIFASNLYGITPDIISTAKGLGGGVPIGATLTRLKDVLEPGDHGSTFGGNFLSTRAGLSVLEILEEEYRSKRLAATIQNFHKYLDEMLKDFHQLFIEKVGIGLMCGLVARDEKIQKKIIDNAFDEQLLILKSGRNVVRFLPSLLITSQEIEEGFQRFQKACKNI
ncbi:aspartate aminotransferase family protein [Helicobacter sp. 11S03491-1]|uniref:aspartate aminotransferase family protein n=1 Tax=Helicobacter sp. 11S03491-1 TaxID=1476196 RepID=UPI000BA65254|nr:aspartate aminotransferase family protein [Helicobacter sp. 11S03491-1]PAF41873.1 aspartate aminotransferase family protein [Helicobacter sp. 11S03491-1]